MKLSFILCSLVLVLSLSGCVTMFEDVRISKAEQRGELKIGMTIAEVAKLVGRQPNRMADTFERKVKADGTYINWSVNRRGGLGSNWSQSYEFEFKEGLLTSWTNR